MFGYRLQSLTKYKGLLAMGIALVTLIIIFVPFQDQSFSKAKMPATIDGSKYGPPPSTPPAPSPRQITSAPTIASTSIGTITIINTILGTTRLLPNATFTITPNPFTTSGSLTVHDNEDTLDTDPTSGIIRLENVKFNSYILEETHFPNGYAPLQQSVLVTVHKTVPNPIITIQNINLRTPPIEPVKISAPYLDNKQFDTFVSKGAAVNNIAINRVNGLPAALFATSDKQVTKEISPRPVTFKTPTAVATTAAQIFESFDIPTYPAPSKDIAPRISYVIPSFVIKQDNSGNNFLVTPKIERTFYGMTLLVKQNSSTASGLAMVQQIKMKFARNDTNNVGFSFGISDTIPTNFGIPKIPSDSLALFLNVDFATQKQNKVNFANPGSFVSSPQFNILVSKSLHSPKLEDGCPRIALLFFNDNKWEPLSHGLIRNNAIDSEGKCGYIIEPGHLSKFAIISANFLNAVTNSTSNTH